MLVSISPAVAVWLVSLLIRPKLGEGDIECPCGNTYLKNRGEFTPANPFAL